MPVRPTLLHRMALVSFLRFRKNLGNLREFFGQMVYRPPGKKIARTPMVSVAARPSLEGGRDHRMHQVVAYKRSEAQKVVAVASRRWSLTQGFY